MTKAQLVPQWNKLNSAYAEKIQPGHHLGNPIFTFKPTKPSWNVDKLLTHLWNEKVKGRIANFIVVILFIHGITLTPKPNITLLLCPVCIYSLVHMNLGSWNYEHGNKFMVEFFSNFYSKSFKHKTLKTPQSLFLWFSSG